MPENLQPWTVIKNTEITGQVTKDSLPSNMTHTVDLTGIKTLIAESYILMWIELLHLKIHTHLWVSVKKIAIGFLSKKITPSVINLV